MAASAPRTYVCFSLMHLACRGCVAQRVFLFLAGAALPALRTIFHPSKAASVDSSWRHGWMTRRLRRIEARGLDKRRLSREMPSCSNREYNTQP